MELAVVTHNTTQFSGFTLQMEFEIKVSRGKKKKKKHSEIHVVQQEHLLLHNHADLKQGGTAALLQTSWTLSYHLFTHYITNVVCLLFV